jgi:predicted P-loop ATPase
MNDRRISPKDFPDEARPKIFQTPTTIENVAYMLEHEGITVRYNVIKKKLEVTVPGDGGTSDNRDNVSITHIISLASLNGMATTLVPNFVDAIGDQHAFNPVADWISSKPWDCVDRLPDFYRTVTTRDDYPTTLKETLLRKWLLSAVAAATLTSGFRNRGVLTLQGPQGIGKTSWVLAVVPDDALRSQCVKVDHHLDTSDKDTVISAVTHWIVELGELDSSFKKDVARLKGFLTAPIDKVRRPYAKVDSEYPRRTVFVATVNENNFLVDSTGNSRFWTIAAVAMDYDHGVDMQQLFAQMAVALAAGDEWWLTSDEEGELALINKPHESVSVVREVILGYFDPKLLGNDRNPYLTATEVLNLVGFDRTTNAQAKECATVLRELIGGSKRVKGRDKWRFPGVIIGGEVRRLKPVDDDGALQEPVYTIPGFPGEKDHVLAGVPSST